MKFVVLLLVLVGALAWLGVSRRRRPPSPPAPPPPPGPGSHTGAIAPPQDMVACAHCGVHLPQSEAVRDAQGHPYCGEAHRQAGPHRGG